MTDMGHLDHLEAVAAADIEHLREKEKTYRGSWKRRGGVGAWMMACRKFDRLEGILSQETPPERGGYNWDVFAAIKADSSGTDGTALAEVRDLRRYLLLVEAEMVSRGLVKMSQPPAVVQVDIRPQSMPPEDDIGLYARMSEVWGVPEDEARRRLVRIAFGPGDAVSRRSSEVMRVLRYKWVADGDEVIKSLRSIVLDQPDTVPRTDSNRHAEPPCRPSMFVSDGLLGVDYVAADIHYLPVPDCGRMAIVDRRAHPELDHLPRLFMEQNYKEWADLPQEYRWLYFWDLDKYRLKEEYREYWGREP